MVGIILASHGSLAAGLLDAATMIVGPQDGVVTLALSPEDDPGELAERLRELLPAPGGGGALILTDLFGASPANAAARLMRDRSDVEIVAGMSLPLLLEVLMARETASAQELASHALNAGREGVRDVGAAVRDALQSRHPEQG